MQTKSKQQIKRILKKFTKHMQTKSPGQAKL